MVRLKATGATGRAKKGLIFQFQYGAIKRLDGHLFADVTVEFQFQYGAIKRWIYAQIIKFFKKFQFQYGAIKSYIVSLYRTLPLKISIPIWCD